jgi:putative ATP-binding cassette transporter
MNLLKLIKKESDASWTGIIIMATITGISNGLILAVINRAAEKAGEPGMNFRYFLLFAITIGIFIVTKKYSITQSNVMVERVVSKIRIRIADKIRRSNLTLLERIGKYEIYTRVTQETVIISQAAGVIINACQAGIMLFFCILYLAWLSKTAFFITLILVTSGVMIYLSNQRQVNREIQNATQKEIEFFDSLNHILDGFKELKINRRKSDDLFHNSLKEIALAVEKIKIQTSIKFISNLIFSQTFFYVLIAVIVFLMPILSTRFSEIIGKLTAAILFIVGPLEFLVGSIPVFIKANVAANNLDGLEKTLEIADEEIEEEIAVEKPLEPFHQIAYQEVVFQYTDKKGKPLFILGPFSLKIRSGEILFLVGGNGSGKSTFLKLITGLYYPLSGCLRWDGKEVDRHTYPVYRELFSAVFSDFHLFDRLYGMTDMEEERVNALLKLMALDKKTSYEEGRFSDINLSTGQRKRLALIVSLLDDKQIMVFDELTADLDPEFRKYYYEVLLKELQKMGKTVIAATHDDRYFHVADKVVKLEYGQLAKDS